MVRDALPTGAWSSGKTDTEKLAKKGNYGLIMLASLVAVCGGCLSLGSIP